MGVVVMTITLTEWPLLFIALRGPGNHCSANPNAPVNAYADVIHTLAGED